MTTDRPTIPARRDDDETRRLLALFYDGQTSLADERHLASLLQADTASADLRTDAAVLAALSTDARRQRLEAMIVQLEADERRVASTERSPRRSRWWMAAAAATLAVVATIAVVARALLTPPAATDVPTTAFVDTCTSADEAVMQVARAVDIVRRHTAVGLNRAASPHQSKTRAVASRHITVD